MDLPKSLWIILFTWFLMLRGYGDPSQDIQFIENKGQWEREILFRAAIQNGFIFITDNALHYLFYEGGIGHHHASSSSREKGSRLDNPGDQKLTMHAVQMHFRGRSGQMIIQAGKKQKAYYNYILGNDPEKWAGRVPAYGELQFRNLYPGIHMKLYSEKGHIKYDMVVEKGADPQQILFEYEGIDDININYNSVYAETSLNTIIENTPYAFQVKNGDTTQVDCNYRLKNKRISFELPGGYDPERQLIIDPLLVFSTYSGSSGDNWGNTATFDDDGNVYSGGTVWDQVSGSQIPTTKGAFQATFGGIWDIALFKFDSTGSELLYGTYLGGSDAETPFSLIVDKNNELLILGITGSGDFPVTGNAFSGNFSGGVPYPQVIGGVNYLNGSDLFIARLSDDGTTLKAATYLGGSDNDGINNAEGFPLSRNYGDEFRGEINIDDNNQVYIASNTSSADFPVASGFQTTYGGGTQDGIIAKLSDDLSEVLWSSYLGGALPDAAYGIRITPSEKIYITGGTMSSDFPVTQNAYKNTFGGDVDGFITLLSADGKFLEAGTFLGTNQYDQSYFIDQDPDKNIWVFGQTSGPYPVTPGVYTNPNSGQFLHKLSADLETSLLSTVIGGGSGIPDISPTAFLVNECGNIFLSGWGGVINSLSSKYNGGNTFGLPVTEDAFQANTDGSDFYLMVLLKDVEKILYGTYLGALNTGSGEHVDGGTSRFDKRGIVYHAICACRDGSQFPTTPGVWSNTNNSEGGCNNGVFKFDLSSLKADFTTDTYEFDNPGITEGCLPFEVVFLNRSIGGKLFQWDFGDGAEKSFQEDSIFYLYEQPGGYEVTLSAFDENTCTKIDIARQKIQVFSPDFTIPESPTICQSDQVVLEAGGGIVYAWLPATGLSNPGIANPVASPDSTIIYQLYIRDQNLCETFDSVQVNVIPEVISDFSLEKVYDCKNHPYVKMTNLSERSNTFIWDFGDGEKSALTDSLVLHNYKEPGNYNIRLEASADSLCTNIKEEIVRIEDIFVPNIITPNDDSKNDFFVIETDAPKDLTIFNRWGKVIFTDKSYQNNWKATGLPAGVYYYELLLDDDAACNGWIQVLK